MELNLNNSSLENQVAFLKKLFDTIPYPIFVKNTKLEYIYANRICEEKNGFEMDVKIVLQTVKYVLKRENIYVSSEEKPSEENKEPAQTK